MRKINFGKFLHNIRKRGNGTQIAKYSGISYVYLLDLEKGARSIPSNNVLLSLAENLPFKKGEKEIFFDLAAEESGRLPVDIDNYIKENKEFISLIRDIQMGKIKKEDILTYYTDKQEKTNEED